MAASMKLYEISDARRALDAWLAESEGELTPELESLLAELAQTADEKIENVALYIRERRAEASAIKGEAKRLTERAQHEDKAADSLTAYLLREMQALEIGRVDGRRCTVALQSNPPSVRGELDELSLGKLMYDGSKFVKHVPATITLDKKAVIDAHKAGHAIPDGLTVEQSVSVRIR